MRNLCMKVSYDGTAYSGFQSQPNGRTIQDELERALSTITGETIRIISAGRTDAGVHAKGQVVNFFTASTMPIQRWCLAVNTLLPRDIVALDIAEVPDHFHARHTDSRKTYVYTINNYRTVDVFQRHYQYHHPVPLDVSAMQQALAQLVGTHDFTSFCSHKSTKQSHVRTIYDAKIEVETLNYRTDPGQLLHIIVAGNGFLYHMVRIIAGTLLHVGEGKIDPAHIEQILHAKDRSLAGPTAAAHGLTLVDITYDEPVF